MRKISTAIIFPCSIFHTASAQRKQIDSLQKLLPSLPNTGRIDCLNKLAHYYCNCFIETSPKYTRTDSAELYANTAYAEAVAADYQFGIASAFLNIGEIYLVRRNFKTAQTFIQKSISAFEKLKAQPELNKAYMRLIDVYLSESDNPSVFKTIQIPFAYYKKTKDLINLCDLWESMGACYSWQGDDEKAFECFKNENKLIKDLPDSASKLRMLRNKQGFYQMAGWSDSLAACTSEIIAYEKQMGIDTDDINKKGFKLFVESKWNSAEYYDKKQFEYIEANNGLDSTVKKRRLLRTNIDLASVYQMEGRHKEALPIFMKALQYDKEKKIDFEVLEVLLNLSGMNMYDENMIVPFTMQKPCYRLLKKPGPAIIYSVPMKYYGELMTRRKMWLTHIIIIKNTQQ